MDPDTVRALTTRFAAMMQDKKARAAASLPEGVRHPFYQQIQGMVHTVLAYEDNDLQMEALSIMPLERLYAEAEQAEQADVEGAWSPGDHLVRALLQWFHDEFFTFVRTPPCRKSDCQSGASAMRALGTEPPTPAELNLGAGRTEVYVCEACGQRERFPRINNVRTLLTRPEFRRGRCGEWANCFTLLCRAVGVRARWVWCREDHVWTEVYSARQQRWVHVDSCEAAFDHPRLYADGWRKRISYCFAYAADGAADVTRRYVRHDKDDDKPFAAPRDAAPERVVQAALDALCTRLRASLPAEERREVEAMDVAERRELGLQ